MENEVQDLAKHIFARIVSAPGWCEGVPHDMALKVLRANAQFSDEAARIFFETVGVKEISE